jgi:hypothetical protein
VFDKEKNSPCSALERHPLLVADSMAPRQFAILMSHFLLPDDYRCLNSVLQVNNVVLLRQVNSTKKFFRIKIIVGYDFVH